MVGDTMIKFKTAQKLKNNSKKYDYAQSPKQASMIIKSMALIGFSSASFYVNRFKNVEPILTSLRKAGYTRIWCDEVKDIYSKHFCKHKIEVEW
jgi:hypothetical protein